LWHGGL
jgi:hypothetical protein